MSAHVEERILSRFKLDAEALRDLDAILRQRLNEIDPTVEATFDVRRRDGLSYSTTLIEDIVAEPNGPESEILSLTCRAKKGESLDLSISFSNSLVLSIKGEDRAKIALLAADIRIFSRERLKGRTSRFLGYEGLVAGVVILLTMFGGMGFDAWSDTRRDRQYDQAIVEYQQARSEVVARVRAENIEFAQALIDDGEEALTLDDLGRKLDFLISERIQAAERALADDPSAPSAPDFPSSSQYWILWLLIGPFALGASVFAALSYWSSSANSVFLIGQRIARQNAHEKRRERIVWGIGVALVVGVLSSILATWLNS